ncbi:MAG: DUF6172 family protein [Mariprofundus sp.]
MKKRFDLTHPKIKTARLFESVRADIKKYLKRERRRALPDGAAYWAFDCKFGPTAEEATVIHVADIGKAIDEAEAQQLTSCYVEILAKPCSAS